MTLTGYNFQLLPTEASARRGRQTAGACRFLWNWALGYRKDVWLAAKSAGATGIDGYMGYEYMAGCLESLKKENPWLADAPHHTLQQTLRDLDKAFASFFEGRAGFPKMRRKGARESFRFPDPKQFTVTADGWVKLPKFGWIRFNQSRPIMGKVKNITISVDGGKWEISLCCEADYRLPNYGIDGIGGDAGVAQDLTLSNGDVLSLGAPEPQHWERLAKLQQAVARKTKGSNRWKKAQQKVAKQHRHMANRRRDRQHKASHELATQFSFVVLEDLKLKNMTASAAGTVAEPGVNVAAKSGLNRELLARGFGNFKRMVAYKCDRAHIPFVLVNPAFTSQNCPRCHHCEPENRKSQAVFRCVACGLEGNADHIAALNIKAAGHAAIARQLAGETPKVLRPRRNQKKTRTHLRDQSVAGSPGIPVKAAQAA
jgi:putative transposase